MKMETDVLIIGAGAAGLRAACAAVLSGARVLVLSRGPCASPEIMGFNAVVSEEDTAEVFYGDLRACACEISAPALSRTLAERSAGEIAFLEGLGLQFDKTPDGRYAALQTLGCRYPRLVHRGSLTGAQMTALMRKKCVESGALFRDHAAVTDLTVKDGRVTGAVGIDDKTGEFLEFACKAAVLATGGAGAVSRLSTYPSGSVGEGCAIALRAGAELVDMEFQQYEPCAFVYPPALTGKIVPTTLLRLGARLLNGDGREFMADYGLTRENARKGALSRAIYSEIAAGRGTANGGVYYDMTNIPAETIIKGHAIFYEPALAAGVDITRVPAEMAPAAHTFLGGVRIKADGSTGVRGLFAAGEVTGGVHGADRLGGCAGAETLVFGGIAGSSAAAFAKGAGMADSPDTGPFYARYRAAGGRRGGAPASELRRRITDTMTKNAGILRSAEGLSEAARELDAVLGALENASGGALEIQSCRNMAEAARIQTEASLMRRESRGVFSRTDFPERDDLNWKKNIVFRLENGSPAGRVEDTV